MADKKRIFLAVNLAVTTTRRIADAAAKMRAVAERKGMRVGWVPAANLHVTLKFLGWAGSDVVAAVRDRVRDAVRDLQGFDLGARGVGAYPTEAHARILWVGVTDPSGTLARLAGVVEGSMAELGFPREERPFSGHVTIGRVKDGRGAEEVLAPFRQTDFGMSVVREVVLYESLMKSTGSEYTPLFRAPLQRPERQTRDVEPEQKESEDPNGGQP
jgi:RNA 2',3'-cyclic 3'-phosphodiesterase